MRAPSSGWTYRPPRATSRTALDDLDVCRLLQDVAARPVSRTPRGRSEGRPASRARGSSPRGARGAAAGSTSRPLPSGMTTSSRMTSGFSARAPRRSLRASSLPRRRARCPAPAASSSLMPVRTTAWSSTIRTRIGSATVLRTLTAYAELPSVKTRKRSASRTRWCGRVRRTTVRRMGLTATGDLGAARDDVTRDGSMCPTTASRSRRSAARSRFRFGSVTAFSVDRGAGGAASRPARAFAPPCRRRNGRGRQHGRCGLAAAAGSPGRRRVNRPSAAPEPRGSSPLPAADSISSEPPTRARRSRMPRRPSASSRTSSWSKPRPSSSIVAATVLPRCETTMLTCSAAACLTTFVSASCTTR